MTQSLHNGSSKVPLMESLGKILKEIIQMIACSSETPLHIVRVYGLSKAKLELSVSSAFFKQAGIPTANMEFIYLESSFMEYSLRCSMFSIESLRKLEPARFSVLQITSRFFLNKEFVVLPLAADRVAGK